MNTLNRIKHSMASHDDEVFLRREFAPYGSPSQVGRALRQLLREGALVRLGLGVYAKARRSSLSRKSIPVTPLEFLAPVALMKLGIDVRPSRLTEEYNSGRSTQIPAGIVFNVGKRRVTRKLGFNRHEVEYEHA